MAFSYSLIKQSLGIFTANEADYLYYLLYQCDSKDEYNTMSKSPTMIASDAAIKSSDHQISSNFSPFQQGKISLLEKSNFKDTSRHSFKSNTAFLPSESIIWKLVIPLHQKK